MFFGTLAGGLGAELSGGIPIAIGIWQGAARGLMVSGLNHFAHQVQEKFQKYLDHSEYLNWYKKTINNINDNIQLTEQIGEVMGGASLADGIKGLLKGSKLTPLAILGSVQFAEASQLARLRDQLTLMKHNYDRTHDNLDFQHGKQTSKGITINGQHIPIPAFGGMGTNIYNITDNYTKEIILSVSTSFNF